LSDEVYEFRHGLSWKPWKDSKPLDLKYLKEEAIDMLHFLLEIFNKLEMNHHDIVEAYSIKHEENKERQRGLVKGKEDYKSDIEDSVQLDLFNGVENG
jgi:dimeric dUTPase (all-alpha-NTP-PPase superfamily)